MLIAGVNWSRQLITLKLIENDDISKDNNDTYIDYRFAQVATLEWQRGNFVRILFARVCIQIQMRCRSSVLPQNIENIVR